MSKQLSAVILEKHCPSMSLLYLDEGGVAFRGRILAAMGEYATTQLVEAQERIETMESGINDLITKMETWRQMCVDEMAKAKGLDDVDIGYHLAGRSKAEYDGILPKLKALSPDNKLKEDA